MSSERRHADATERDREMATEISVKLLSRWANDAIFERFKREISEGLAAARAEGRREAIEECAKIVRSYASPRNGLFLARHPMAVLDGITDQIRALAETAAAEPTEHKS